MGASRDALIDRASDSAQQLKDQVRDKVQEVAGDLTTSDVVDAVVCADRRARRVIDGVTPAPASRAQDHDADGDAADLRWPPSAADLDAISCVDVLSAGGGDLRAWLLAAGANRAIWRPCRRGALPSRRTRRCPDPGAPTSCASGPSQWPRLPSWRWPLPRSCARVASQRPLPTPAPWVCPLRRRRTSHHPSRLTDSRSHRWPGTPAVPAERERAARARTVAAVGTCPANRLRDWSLPWRRLPPRPALESPAPDATAERDMPRRTRADRGSAVPSCRPSLESASVPAPSLDDECSEGSRRRSRCARRSGRRPLRRGPSR